MMEKTIKVGDIIPYEEFNKFVYINIEEIWKSIDPNAARVEYIPMYKSLIENKKAEIRGKPIIIGGRGPIWLYCIVLHELHGINPIVAIEDPKVSGAIVIYSHIASSEVLKKAEIEAKQFISKVTTINVDGVRETFVEMYKKLVEILETQKEMYKEYLELKKRQVELLERVREYRAD